MLILLLGGDVSLNPHAGYTECYRSVRLHCTTVSNQSSIRLASDNRFQNKENFVKINVNLHLAKNFYTFHAFRRSCASLAYELDIPAKPIKAWHLGV